MQRPNCVLGRLLLAYGDESEPATPVVPWGKDYNEGRRPASWEQTVEPGGERPSVTHLLMTLSFQQ